VCDRTLPLPAGTDDWKRPVFGYTGTIHPDRVDAKLLIYSAQRLPNATFAMVGPNHFSAALMETMKEQKNIRFSGPVAYREIPSYMRAFDICMTPHLMTPFTESLNPIKLWEYLAAGKPIVSTDVAGFRDFPHLVRIARTPEQFVSQLQAALEEGDALVTRRRQEARAHSWESRVDQIEAIMEQCLQNRNDAIVNAS
jgi:glycosyltransferase involved in cell wall biosynthesis